MVNILIKTNKRKNLLTLLAIALSGFLLYAPSLNVPFQFDDDIYVVTNPVVKNLDFFLSPLETAAGNTLSPALRSAFMTRYLGYLTFALNYNINGLHVTGYHIVNLLLHILNAWLVYLIAAHIFKNREEPDAAPAGMPLFVALLFLCHPVQTHAVTYITSRFVLLAAFFSLFSLCAYIRSRSALVTRSGIAWKTAAIMSAAAAMLTKEFTFTLPFVVALYEFSFFRGTLRERLRALWPYALVLPIIPLLVFLQQGTLSALESTMRTITAADVSQISRFDYLLTQFRVLVLYLRLLLFPVGQNVDHAITVQHSLASPAVLGSLFVLLPLLAYAGYAAWRYRQTDEPSGLKIASFGILWFFILLSVESSIIPLGELSAEYRLYLPSIGIIIAFASLCSLARRRFALKWNVVRAVFAALLILLCMATFMRNRVWQSDITLWQDAVFKSPAKARPYYNLGVALTNAGRLNEAISMFERAVAIKPEHPLAWNNLGAALSDSGRPGDAVKVLEKAVSNDPNNPEIYFNLGRAFLLLGDSAPAISHFSRAIALKPSYVDAYINLAAVYNQVGRSAETVSLLEKNYGLLADRAEGHFNLCIAYSMQKNREASARELQIVNRLDPRMGQQLVDYLRQVSPQQQTR